MNVPQLRNAGCTNIGAISLVNHLSKFVGGRCAGCARRVVTCVDIACYGGGVLVHRDTPCGGGRASIYCQGILAGARGWRTARKVSVFAV